ncbi:MAG: septal ring lytic transglycosylase RlpA family protein [Pseudomonadota bacterium]
MNRRFPTHLRRAILMAGLAIALAACSTSRHAYDPNPAPHYKIGKPYKVNGRWYHPEEDNDYEAVGIASWYGRDFHGRRTANGETFDMNRLSAAHTTLPMPSMVEVTNLNNGRKVVVRVNDRGPFASNRIIDLSREAARRLGFEKDGLARVKVRFVGAAPLMARAPKTSPRVTRAAAMERPVPQRSVAAAPAISPMPVRAEQEIRVIDGTAVETSHYPASPPPPTLQPVSLEIAPIEEADAAPTPNEHINDQTGALYVIRIAALSQLNNIDRLKAQLEPIGPLRLTRVESDAGSVFYRVNMGPFASLDTANERLDAVRNAGYNDAGVITLTP